MNELYNTILNEDCLITLDRIKNKSIDLIILDPPYNIGAAKWDKISNKKLQTIIEKCFYKLKDTGSLYLWGTHKNNEFLENKLFVDNFIKENIPTFEFKNWIVWIHDVKAHRQLKNRYLDKHEDIIFYAGKNNTFNIVRDYPPEKQLKIFKNKYDKNFFVKKENLPPSQQKIFFNGLQLGSPAKSWWKGKSNISNGKQIKKFAGYKSDWVCDRIITVSSNKNDIVFIPFCGTGTECVSAKKNNRTFISCEIDKERFEISKNRMKNVRILEKN